MSIELPDADDLDTVNAPTEYKVELYLALEPPAVYAHTGIGNIGTPGDAHERRALHLADYGSGVIGQSVLDWLTTKTETLASLAAEYRGSEWTGSNWRGKWAGDDDVDERYGDVAEQRRWTIEALCESLSENLESYWDAADWFAGDDSTWERLAGEQEASLTVDVAKVAQALVDETPVRHPGVHLHLADVVNVLEQLRDDWLDARCCQHASDGARCVRERSTTIETMPPQLRASHEAAGNRGVWPANGAERLEVCDDCCGHAIDGDVDGWTFEVES